MVNKIIIDLIESHGYSDIKFDVTLHKNKLTNKISDQNIQLGFCLEGFMEHSSQTFVSGKMVILPANEDIIANLRQDLFAVYAGFPAFIDNPGAKMFFEGMGKGISLPTDNGKSYICIIYNLWIHPFLKKDIFLKKVTDMLINMLISEFECRPETIFLYPKKEEVDNFAEMAFKLGFVNINRTCLYLYTDYYCCHELVDIAIKTNAVETNDDNVLVCKTFDDPSLDYYEEVTREKFIDMVFKDPMGQLHIINAVFNNKE